MPAAAGRSRQLVRALLGPSSSADESRGYIQARLLLFTRLMFGSFGVLIVFLAAMYGVYPQLKPELNSDIFAGEIGALAVMALIWRGLLVRRDLSVEALYRIDVIYAVGIGTAFATSALLAPELHAAAWTSLIFATFSAFTRALVIPSSGRRTAAVSGLAFVPLVIAAIGLVQTTTEELPRPAFVGGTIVISAVVVLLSATGSRIIYGLRLKVSEAMQLGQYTLEGQIGAGGMGTVHRARHALLRRDTAIKLLRPERVGGSEYLDRFEREVQVMSTLTHPNTVAVYDYGRTDGVLYYAMEYLGGGIDLHELVRRHGAQPAARVVNILAQVCGALQEAHDAGLIHRDIKPANIILCQRGGIPDFAKVLDFGLVKDFATETDASAQIILGTPDYVAPEQVTAPAAVGPGTDLYALGAVGYYLLTGKKVFEGKTAWDVCAKHATATPRPPSELVPVPAELEAIVLACLEKAPSARPASATALAQRLRALPATSGWDEAAAAAWWRDVHKPGVDPASATSAMATMTLTVDLEHR